MGGHMQPQGHLQVVSHMVDRGLDPLAKRSQARTHRPKMIIAGYSAYSRTIDFAAFAEVAKGILPDLGGLSVKYQRLAGLNCEP